ncbi:hypothetical protein [Serratia plymuthica]|uniref:hypothetical protein n=1 Tax=Serratia plymuthica TaxID=82996 RepID=UPI001AD815F5|nr:hypothetical protein [Serratia plymuthica]
MEFLKAITPFLTFFIGILLIPYVEKVKKNLDISKTKEKIFLELSDVLDDLKNDIPYLYQSLLVRKGRPNEFTHINMPTPISLFILNAHLKDVYSTLTNEQRKACKLFTSLVDSINEKGSYITDNYIKNNDECYGKQCSMLYTMLSLFYLLHQYITLKDNFIRPVEPNHVIVSRASKIFNIEFPPT